MSKMSKEMVILVDANDVEQGMMEKHQAHENGGTRHRAFSIFIFNTKGEVLLQQRAAHKYHSGSLWTNTCCSHPQPGETVLEAASRRLMEEMGMTCNNLEYKFKFEYKAALDHGMTEWEIDHVVFGISDSQPNLNSEEVQDYKYVSLEELDQSINSEPEMYTAWLKDCFSKVLEFASSEKR